MPSTARADFDADLDRARELVSYGKGLPSSTTAERLIRDDVLRSGWMFGVGALDSYFCDAFTDTLARTLRAKDMQQSVALTERLGRIEVPVEDIFPQHPQRVGWRWRLAARRLMERDSVLSLEEIKKCVNTFTRQSRRLFRDPVLDQFVAFSGVTKRLLGVDPAAYPHLRGKHKKAARTYIRERLTERFDVIFRRRHECIHTCDRPRVTPQRITSPAAVKKVLNDVEALVLFCDEHLETEFNQLLRQMGADATTLNATSY